jgi:hypothetical protein
MGRVPWYVVVAAGMVCAGGIFRLLSYWIEGHDDPLFGGFFTAAITLFTGSYAIARAASNVHGSGDGDK